eukprot:CAMPEP_0174349290 /NCGR_PEP_ID=MMETSP0811_2-20130205/5996_1 /TAXON_ID=73025 ORGANISM="Eutreptiella gymnastica-like, Strain CCMP1594" /NCGR_SAMPLE_ID=MMETSP0811_2 /ASSEMBLY_ACC=CAM_ASM_000667 /LENGTH=73 /DNA_ID=CAMNT_0015476579 /DNA_START=69 /DNA_END=290 /DNA_ORIENTATION=+
MAKSLCVITHHNAVPGQDMTQQTEGPPHMVLGSTDHTQNTESGAAACCSMLQKPQQCTPLSNCGTMLRHAAYR